MNDKQIEQYRNWALEAPAYDRGAIINQVSADGVYSNAGGGAIEHHLDDVRTIIAQHDRIAELENSNTHAGLRAMYQKAQARIAELERGKDLNKLRADAVREALEACCLDGRYTDSCPQIDISKVLNDYANELEKRG